MRTTRVLDLCREAEQSVTDCSEHGYAIRKLAQAIREMTEGDPNKPDANLDDLLTELQGIRDEIREFKDCVMSLAPPPKSDPLSPP